MVKQVKRQYEQLAEVKWIDDNASEDEIAYFKKDAMDGSKFDTLQLRRNMWTALEKGEAEMSCKSCYFARVFIIHLKGKVPAIPWKLWGRILQAVGIRGQRIFFYASPVKRVFPALGEAVGPEHVNGGYTYRCTTDGIIIYREEEATRVLVHELLHASCTDNINLHVEALEAETETYAELFLVAQLSKGSLRVAERLWKKQEEWIAEQNMKLIYYHGVRSESDYAYRYTLGRDAVLRRLGIEIIYGKQKPKQGGSMRLTSPALESA